MDLFAESSIIPYLVNKFGPILVTGEGGISASGVKLVLELEKDIINDPADIVQKIGIYLKAALSKQEEPVNGKSN